MNSILEKIEKTDSIILETIDKFLTRGEIGLEKYGVTMDRTDLEIVDWINPVSYTHLTLPTTERV